MQTNVNNNPFTSGNLKCYVINKQSNKLHQNDFMNGIHNAYSIVQDLENSLSKSSKYEDQLLECKAAHNHSHFQTTWWDSDLSDKKSLKQCNIDGSKSSRKQESETWSTMTIVCLQYQYEELSKRYKALLQDYDERCADVTSRDVALSHLRQHLTTTHAQLAHAHKALLNVGNMYLALRTKRTMQKSSNKEKIKRMKAVLRDMVEAAERSRLEFDSRLSKYMTDLKDSDAAMLLDEMRRCNLLFLENLRLRAQLEGIATGCSRLY